jgi:hypothetical protein
MFSPCGPTQRVASHTLTTPTPTPTPFAVPGVSEYYKTPTTNMTFYMNTSFVGWQEAENMCKRNGGHLASYSSSAEQVGGGRVQNTARLARLLSVLQQIASGFAYPSHQASTVGSKRGRRMCLKRRLMWRTSLSAPTT